MKRGIGLLGMLFVAACGGGDDGGDDGDAIVTCNPLGNWVLEGTAGQGNCVDPGYVITATLTVSANSDGTYNITSLGETFWYFDGIVGATVDGCYLSGTATSMGAVNDEVTYSGQEQFNLQAEDGVIDGSSTVDFVFSNGVECDQVFAYTGTH